jgi:hypothetical protein
MHDQDRLGTLHGDQLKKGGGTYGGEGRRFWRG